MNGYITHASTGTKFHPVICGGLLMMPHEAGLRFDPGHVLCSVCSIRGKRKAEPIYVDRDVYLDVLARCPIPAPPPDDTIVSVAQLDKFDRRCFHAVATGAIGEAVFKTKASLKRLHEVGLVDGWKDPAAAKLTPLGEEFAASNALGEGIGGQVQVPMFAEPAASRQEPAPVIVAESAPVTPAVEARPFLRWCGGKGDLLGGIMAAMPEKFGRLLVPFVGGGAIVFAMPGRVAYMSDANTHLINAYTCIRDSANDVIAALQEHRSDDVYYYPLRDAFNEGYGDPIWRSAAFIYMNRVCFNGVCRYTLSGKFNVPWGKNPNAAICDADKLRACSAALQGVEIVAEDFRAVEERAQPGDLVYLDPPYVPESKTASFTGYWGKWEAAEDEACAALFRRMVARGVYVIASNSDTPRARELYTGFEIRQLTRANSVNSKASARGGKAEILVLGGTWTPRGAS